MGSGEMSMGTGSDIWILPSRVLIALRGCSRSQSDEASAKFSADGKWVAYCSNRTGRSEIYVEPWPGPGMWTQLTSEGGTDPLFSRDGHELFYRNGDKMMVMQVSTAGEFKAGPPVVLWVGHYSHGLSSSCGPPGVSSANYDVSADGQHFLMIKDNTQDAGSTSIVVVLHWADELKRLVQERKK
jgi:hypothetical protein